MIRKSNARTRKTTTIHNAPGSQNDSPSGHLDTTNRQENLEPLQSNLLDDLFPTRNDEDATEVPDTLTRWLREDDVPEHDTTEDADPDEYDDKLSELPQRVQAAWPAQGRDREGSMAGSVASNKSAYLTDLEAQMRDNARRKKLEAEQDQEYEAKLAREREQSARYGGGGEPLRNPDGSLVTNLRLAPNAWSPDTVYHESAERSRSLTPEGRRSLTPEPRRSTQPRPPLPAKGTSVVAAPQQIGSAGEEALRIENAALKAEVSRLTAQMDLLLQAFQLERQKPRLAL